MRKVWISLCIWLLGALSGCKCVSDPPDDLPSNALFASGPSTKSSSNPTCTATQGMILGTCIECGDIYAGCNACEVQNNKIVCTACVSGLQPADDGLGCTSGVDCSTAIAGCQFCAFQGGMVVCTACSDQFALDVENKNLCIPCNAIPHCTQCKDAPGAASDPPTKSDIECTACDTGSVQDAANPHISCNLIPNCEACQDASDAASDPPTASDIQCSRCKDEFFIDDEDPNVCTKCTTSKKCAVCLSGGGWKQSGITRHSSCTICPSQKPGFGVFRICTACSSIRGCKACSANGGTKCIACATGPILPSGGCP